MAFIFREADAYNRRLKKTLLMQELVRNRVMTVGGMLLPSSAHDDATMAQTLTAFRSALTIVAEADRNNDVHRHIELVVGG